MEESLRKFMAEFEKRHEENSNLIKEIRASTDAAIRNQGASIKALEIQIGQMSKSISTSVETDTTLIRRIGPSRYAVSGPQNSKLFFVPSQAAIPFPSRLYDDCYDDEEGSYGLKDLDAYLIRTTLIDDALPLKEKDPRRLGELAPTKLIVELADKTVKRPKGIAKNVLVGIDKFVFSVDFIVLDMSKHIKTPLILERPFLSTAHAKIDVFKRKITLRVGNDKVVFKSEVVDEPMMDIVKTRYDDEIIDGLDEYPSYCDFDRKIHIDCAYNLQFSWMIGYEHVHANFFHLLSINVMSKSFYNSIMKDKILQLWEIWILTAMKEWVISLLEVLDIVIK
ncbi:zinc finger, CCHC-type containing protein [Tanacetum coccineum]